jgi:hypothetical protein
MQVPRDPRPPRSDAGGNQAAGKNSRPKRIRATPLLANAGGRRGRISLRSFAKPLSNSWPESLLTIPTAQVPPRSGNLYITSQRLQPNSIRLHHRNRNVPSLPSLEVPHDSRFSRVPPITLQLTPSFSLLALFAFMSQSYPLWLAATVIGSGRYSRYIESRLNLRRYLRRFSKNHGTKSPLKESEGRRVRNGQLTPFL